MLVPWDNKFYGNFREREIICVWQVAGGQYPESMQQVQRQAAVHQEFSGPHLQEQHSFNTHILNAYSLRAEDSADLIWNRNSSAYTIKAGLRVKQINK